MQQIRRKHASPCELWKERSVPVLCKRMLCGAVLAARAAGRRVSPGAVMGSPSMKRDARQLQ